MLHFFNNILKGRSFCNFKMDEFISTVPAAYQEIYRRHWNTIKTSVKIGILKDVYHFSIANYGRPRPFHRLVNLGEIIATQRRATPTQRHAKHGSTLKEKLAFLSGTMDFHKPNGSEQIQFFPNIPENIFGNDQREFHQYRMKKKYFRSRRCV